jgi:D-3-phosphoglycerate dehydrogenase
MKILVCDKIAPEGIERLKEAGDVVVSTGLGEAELIEAARDASAIVVRSDTRITAPVIEAAKELKVIGRAGVGVDNIAVDAATTHGVLVVNSPGGNTVSAAELAITIMLAAARRVPFADAEMKKRNWAKSKCMGIEVTGKTLGIVGLGKIGGEVARRARGLEMTVFGYDPGLSADHMRGRGVEPATLDEILEKSDFVTLHVPGGSATKALIGAPELAKMKKTAILVNCSRGGVVDEAALAEALQNGAIGGAAIDVFEDEPKPWESPLIDAPNIVLTPHLGASTADAQVGATMDVVTQIAEVLAGGQPTSAVNLPRIPEATARELQPWVELARRLGSVVAHMATSGLKRAWVEYLGGLCEFDCSLLTRSALVGLLSKSWSAALNVISAPAVAAERGVKVSETKSDEDSAYHACMRLTAEFDGGDITVSGTLRGIHEARVVSVQGYRVDFVPAGHMMFVWYSDQPGVIGRVGTIMGDSGVNIGQMHVGRNEIGGTALMTLNVDSEVGEDTAGRVRGLDVVRDLRILDLG